MKEEADRFLKPFRASGSVNPWVWAGCLHPALFPFSFLLFLFPRTLV